MKCGFGRVELAGARIEQDEQNGKGERSSSRADQENSPEEGSMQSRDPGGERVDGVGNWGAVIEQSSFGRLGYGTGGSGSGAARAVDDREFA